MFQGNKDSFLEFTLDHIGVIDAQLIGDPAPRDHRVDLEDDLVEGPAVIYIRLEGSPREL